MSDAPESRTAAVKSVLVAVRVLEALAVAGSPLRVTDIARLLGEPKGRMHRHLITLRQAGLVAQDPATERYHLTWRLFEIGQAAGEQFDLKRVAEPEMHRLRDAAGQSVLLAVPAGSAPLVVHALEADNKVSITVKPGNRPPPHCSAQGRVMLAFASKEACDRLLAGALAPLTHLSMTDAAAIRARLALVRTRLWETAPSETMLGINVLAAPLFTADDMLVGSIGLVGSEQFVEDPPAPAQLLLLRDAAAAISRRLGSDRYSRDSAGTKSRQ